MTELLVPSEWNSVHQPIIYEFDFRELPLGGVNNVGSYAQFNFFPPAPSPGLPLYTSPNPAVGDRFYVPTGTYQGYHTVTSIQSIYLYTTSTAYVSNQSGVNVKHVTPVTFTLKSGYNTGEGWEVELPITNIIEFTPEATPDVTLRFDVSGYLKSIFTISQPTIGVDFSLFNRFRLSFYDYEHTYYQVLNSSISTEELNSVYFGTGVYLSSSTTQIIFNCGKTILSILDATGVVINTEATNGDTGADYYYDDFQQEDYLTQISI